MTVPSADLPHRLRDALVAADFTVDTVAGLLGPVAHGALARNQTAPGLARTTDGSPLATLTRLFLLQAAVPRSAADAALPDLVDRLAVEGVLEAGVGEVRARLDCRPYSAPDALGDHDFWVVSDLTPGLDGAPNHVTSDHVLGISSASTSLAQLTIREDVASALDLGTGCGVQALHLATHAGRVVATDVNPRALRVARLNAALNGLDQVEVRDGSYFEPVRGEQFDLIATNPPFVISPGNRERLVYRDSGLPGDRVVEDIVRTAPRHLVEGGWCQVLANWVIAKGQPWDERLAGWLGAGPDGPECDALVVQREVLDPAAYVELWLADEGAVGTPDYLRRYDTWLSWFEEQGIEGVGFGWINLRRRVAGEAGPVRHRLEEWPYDIEQPIASAIAAWGDAVDELRRTDDDALLGRRLLLAEGVVQETVGAPGAEDPEAIVLRQQRGFRRGHAADTVTAAIVGACDGELALGVIVDAVAQLLEQDAADLRATYLPVVRQLVEDGFLTL
ncbi:class I SAM-dependent methyltransferase [Nocardioides zeae]|uniref:Class I SAM-dependent methyltransferase n=1 Tax=Nocardioides imazamoxiresistens TaxID=3231893 RepID=A0ABU3Q1J6_9ACTN|nr:class I SAM-dependent methyltransferase [Nocardioides zeae]MDT9595387.1 class I SAM-dependent methyltransferase [Nocardioides zeae]